MLRRKMYDFLKEWKSRPHKSLVISGQRQVGKTYIIREFGRNEYTNLIELNFSTSKIARNLFDGNLDVDTIIKKLSIYFPSETITRNTLLFFDEIQECPNAYCSVKCFTEDGRYDLVCSGSLLGVELPAQSRDGPSPLIPMGYEERETMFALDFEEFLWAKGVKEETISEVKCCIRDRKPIDPFILDLFNGYYREFMIVGGMPKSVECFIETKQFTESRRVQKQINDTCARDINRYNAKRDRIKTGECFESIPDQLASTNKKFMFSRINDEQSRKARDKYAENLLWIKGAGYGNFCYKAKDIALPLLSERACFKIYLSDTGLLVNRYGDECAKAIFEKRLDYNCGSIAENAVAEGLMKSGYQPRYHSVRNGPKMMEIDFLIENGDGLVAIEVKSGKKRESPSIEKVGRFYETAHRIKLSEDNISSENGIECLPLFASSFFRELEPEWNGPKI